MPGHFGGNFFFTGNILADFRGVRRLDSRGGAEARDGSGWDTELFHVVDLWRLVVSRERRDDVISRDARFGMCENRL